MGVIEQWQQRVCEAKTSQFSMENDCYGDGRFFMITIDVELWNSMRFDRELCAYSISHTHIY